MKRLDWRRVEPVLVNVIVDLNSTEYELSSAVKVMLKRSEELSMSADESLAILYCRSIGQFDRINTLLDDFFRQRNDDEARRVVERSDRRRRALASSRVIHERVDRFTFSQLLRPLIDRTYGIDKKFGKTFGTSKANAGFSVEFKNLAQIYVSIFDAKVDFEMNNVAKAQIVAFGMTILLVDGEVDFDAGISYKNQIFSDLLNVVVDTAVEVVGVARDVIAPIVEIIIRGVDYLRKEFSDIDKLIEPVQPFIKAVHKAVHEMDVAINVSYEVQSFIEKAKAMISNFGNLDFAYKIVHRVVAFVDTYVKTKLKILVDLCSTVEADVLKPIARAHSFVSDVSEDVLVATAAIESFSLEDAKSFAHVISDLTKSILHYNASASSNGTAIGATLRRYVNQSLSHIIDTSSGRKEVVVLSQSFSAFVNVSQSLIDGFENDFPSGVSSGKQLARKFEKSVETTLVDMKNSEASISAIGRQLKGYSALSNLSNVVKELNGQALLRPGIASSIGPLLKKFKPIQTKLCSSVGKTLRGIRTRLLNITHLGNSSFMNMTEKVVGYLRKASSTVFKQCSVNGSLYDSVDLFKLVKSLVAKGVDLLSKFIDDEVLSQFNKYAKAFADRVGDFVESKIEEFAKAFGEKMKNSTHFLKRSHEFMRFLKLAKEASDFAVFVAKWVPEMKTVATYVNEVLDKVVNVAGWVEPILEHITNSSAIVEYAKKGKEFVEGLLMKAIGKVDTVFEHFKEKLLDYVRKAANVVLEHLSGGINFVQNLINQLLPAGRRVVAFVEKVESIGTTIEQIGILFDQTCAFGSDGDTLSTLDDVESKVGVLLSEWNGLVTLTTDPATLAHVERVASSAQPIESFSEKFSAFRRRLTKFSNVHSGGVESYVDLKCSPDSLCTKDIFVADVKAIASDAKELVNDMKHISTFFDQSSTMDPIVRQWSEQISKVSVQLDDLTQLVHSSQGVTVFGSVRNIVDSISEVAGTTFDPDSGAIEKVFNSAVSGFLGLDVLHKAASWLRNTWSIVSNVVTRFVQPALDDVSRFSDAVTSVCEFFSHVFFIRESVGPVLHTIDTLQTYAKKMQDFMESALFFRRSMS